MSILAPTLRTDRLTLRPPVPGDFPAYAALMASPRAEMMGGPYSETEAWGAFCAEAAGWALFGAGGLTVDTAAGRTVGVVAINMGLGYPEAELGWHLYDGAEGNGYATEAARALRDWGLGPGGLATLVSYIGPENTASERVAQRLGGRPDAEAPRQPGAGNEDDLVYRYDPPGEAS